jgi:hypothetical protein
MTRFLLLSDSCGFVDMGRCLLREDGSVVYNCCCPRQRSHFRVRVPRVLWPYFTVPDSRLSFSSPSTTRRATVEVFDPASTRDGYNSARVFLMSPLGADRVEDAVSNSHFIVARGLVAVGTYLFRGRYLIRGVHPTISICKVKVSLFLNNWVVRHEDLWESECIDPHILDVGTSWRWVVSFTPRSLYPWEKSPRYPLDRRLGRPQTTWRGEPIFPLPGLELQELRHPARSQSLYRLRNPGSYYLYVLDALTFKKLRFFLLWFIL